MLPFKGFMIPGLGFKAGYSMWLLNWDDNPTGVKPLIEAWVFTPEQKRICYVNSPQGVAVFQKYHQFHEVLPAPIRVDRLADGWQAVVGEKDEPVLSLKVKTGFDLSVAVINLLLKSNPKAGEKGRTETGKAYFNQPQSLAAIRSAQAVYQGLDLGPLVAPRQDIRVGDGRVSKKPLVNYCTHWLEA